MATQAAGDLRLEGLTKEFETFTAVHPMDLVIPQGAFFALLGPSGCGKTTTLRMVAGLEQPTGGRIHIGDADITDTKAHQRNVNTVFQSYALFPHMTVFENVAFGLKRRGDKAATAKATEVLELVQLGEVAKKKPAQLSGGMQQRVALARAVVNRPDVLLLDEPLGALDLKLRRQMQIELKRIQQEVGITFIHVTHDQEEAMTMADTIAVMNAGRIEQLGDPATLYERPASTFVANFLGQSNLLKATVTGGASGAEVPVTAYDTRLVVAADHVPEGTKDIWLGVRPEKLRLGEHGGPNRLRGRVTDVSFTGVATQYMVRMPWGQELTVVQQNDGSGRARHGEDVTVSWAAEHGFALDAAQAADAGVEEDELVAEVAAIGAGTPVQKPVRRGRWVPYALLAPGLLWLVVFFVAPMLTLGSQSLQEGNVDEGYAFTGNVGIYADAIQRYWPHLLRSIGYAATATVLTLLLGYPLAYFIAQKAGRWKNIMLVLVVAPFFTSFLIRTLAWRTILSDTGPVTAFAQSTGLTSVLQAVGLTNNDTLLASKFAVIAGLTYNFLPFMILPLYASLERLDGRLVEAAGDLYASPWQAFRRVTWPLSLPGVVAGTLLTFIPAAGDFINSRLLGNTQTVMIGQVIDSQFLRVLDYPLAAALSFILLVLIVTLVAFYVRRAGTEELV